MRVLYTVTLALIGGTVGERDPVPATQILPPHDYTKVLHQARSTSIVGDTTKSLNIVNSPTVKDSGVKDSRSVDSSGYQASAIGASVTAQAVVSGMDLQTCAEQVRFTNQQYTQFQNTLAGLSHQVNQAELKLKGIDVVTHNIVVSETNFGKELDRLQQLYNALAVRSNALGRWMSDEKTVRDNLRELYKQMVAKTVEEEQRLATMGANLKIALSRLNDIEKQSSRVLSSVASAQNAMYDWSANVTVSVNTHTTKLESLKQSMGYRVTQMDTAIPEMANIARRVQFIARSFGETNLAYAAANVLSQVESVLQPTQPSDTIMTIPR